MNRRDAIVQAIGALFGSVFCLFKQPEIEPPSLRFRIRMKGRRGPWEHTFLKDPKYCCCDKVYLGFRDMWCPHCDKPWEPAEESAGRLGRKAAYEQNKRILEAIRGNNEPT